MLEAQVERRLQKLKDHGFDVFKLRTPGNNGVMDRMILWPTYAPAPPVFVELKRPGKEERLLQATRRENWRNRGCDVRDMCSTLEEVDALVARLIDTAKRREASLYA